MPFAWRLLFCVDPLLKVMEPTQRFTCVKSVFEDESVQPSTLALLLNDFENGLGRFTDKSVEADKAILPLEEVLELEGIFRERAINAIETGAVLKQNNGLNFLWILGQIDAELVSRTKKTIITDDVSLARWQCHLASCSIYVP